MLPFFKKAKEQLLTPSWERPKGPLWHPRKPQQISATPMQGETIEPLYPGTHQAPQSLRRQEPISAASRPPVSAPVRLPYSHPTRKAARIVAKEQRVERIAKYLAEGLSEAEASKRATIDAYKDATRA